MSDLLQLLPIYTFMLIPLWIPLIAAGVGLVSDLVKAPAKAVVRAEARAEARHAAHLSPAGPPVLAEGTAR